MIKKKTKLGNIFKKKKKKRNLESEIVKLNTIIKELKKQNNILKDEITKNVKQKISDFDFKKYINPEVNKYMIWRKKMFEDVIFTNKIKNHIKIGCCSESQNKEKNC